MTKITCFTYAPTTPIRIIRIARLENALYFCIV